MSSVQTTVSDFIGKVIRTKVVQVASVTTTIKTEYGYDHRDRLKTVDESYNLAAPVRVAAYDYNELGQLVKRNLHALNNPVAVGSNVILNENDVVSSGQEKTVLATQSINLTSGFTAATGSTFSAKILSQSATGYLQSVDYRYNIQGQITSINNSTLSIDDKNDDANDVLLTLQRNAILSGSISAVDNLSYTYDGNRLLNVSDGGSYAQFGFKNITGSDTAYSYDANGNMNVDPKKGINLDYNVLNRTEKITVNTSSGRYIKYTYDAGGNLIRKQAFDNNNLVKTTDYIGGFVYEDNLLTYFGMSEGRVRNSNGTLKLEYMIKDQQGNVRVSFEEQNGVAAVRQENSYYPFGLTMPGSVVPTAANKNLYNAGSEWQNDFGNLPDLQQTFYRMYDAALGRFISVDPLAEASASFTSYQYGLNNPILFNDPLGDQAEFTSKRTGPGSGNHWSDGIYYSDWTLYGGSEMYRNGIAAGMTDWKGTLYYSYSSKQSLISKQGDHGYYTFEGRITDYSYGKSNERSNIFLNKAVGPHGTWHSVDANEGGVLDNAWDWVVANKEKLMATGGALANGYAGVTEIAGGSALMAAPTGVTQVAGGYLIADGATRVATAAVNIYGIWSGNQSATNAPHNVLSLASMAVTSNHTTQQLFQLGGDFGLSRQNLINLANGGFTNVFSAGQGGWQVIRPYKDAYTNL